MKEVDRGHVYDLFQLGSDEPQRLTFIKRSGGAIQYTEEWAGVQSQEVIRALIARTKYLNSIIPCGETERAIEHLRKALWEYEARAYRRKRQELNRERPEHDEEATFPYGPEDIERWPIGADGHIQYLESEILYYMNFGACDAEPIPGVDPFAIETDPVYKKAMANLVASKKP